MDPLSSLSRARHVADSAHHHHTDRPQPRAADAVRRRRLRRRRLLRRRRWRLRRRHGNGRRHGRRRARPGRGALRERQGVPHHRRRGHLRCRAAARRYGLQWRLGAASAQFNGHVVGPLRCHLPLHRPPGRQLAAQAGRDCCLCACPRLRHRAPHDAVELGYQRGPLHGGLGGCRRLQPRRVRVRAGLGRGLRLPARWLVASARHDAP